MMIGKGSTYSTSRKQRINARSSTEAELIGVNDAMSMILWTRLFLEAQGYEVTDNVVFQDNQSTMLLAKSGRQSSGQSTRHIEIRYYFVTDNVKRGKLNIEYCPTEEMIGDFFTKPLQGTLFRKFRKKILNLPDDLAEVQQECVGTHNNNDKKVDKNVSAGLTRGKSYADVVRHVPSRAQHAP